MEQGVRQGGRLRWAQKKKVSRRPPEAVPRAHTVHRVCRTYCARGLSKYCNIRWGNTDAGTDPHVTVNRIFGYKRSSMHAIRRALGLCKLSATPLLNKKQGSRLSPHLLPESLLLLRRENLLVSASAAYTHGGTGSPASPTATHARDGSASAASLVLPSSPRTATLGNH